MEVHLYFKIDMVKRSNGFHFHLNSNIFANRTQVALKYFWIFMPAAYYIAMLCMYSKIQSMFSFNEMFSLILMKL